MKEREESRLSESPTGRAGTGTRRRARSPRIGFSRPNPNTVDAFLEVGIRSRNRNARSTRTLRPHDEGMEGVGRRNPSSAPTDVFFSLRARSHESSGVVPKIGIENRGVGLRATPEDRRGFRRKRKRRFEKTNRRTSETPSPGGSRVERALHEKPHALGKGLRPVDEHRGTTVDVVPGRNVPRTVGIG